MATSYYALPVRDQVQLMYVAYFGRAGAPGGVNHWIDDINVNHFTIEQVGDTFALQPEAKEKYTYLAYPNLGDPEAFVKAIYNNLFERDPAQGGLDYWVDRLTGTNTNGTNSNGEHINPGRMIAAIINGAYANPNSTNDVASMENKIQVANYFTQKLIDNHITWNYDTMHDDAAACIADVTWDPATIATGKNRVDASVNAFLAENGQVFTLTDKADAVPGTAGNDTIVATEATLSSADIIDGGDGTADLFRYASSGNNKVNEAGFEIKNVETVQITSDAVGGTTFDFTGTQGVQTIRNFNSSQDTTLTGLKTLAPTIEIDSIGTPNGPNAPNTTIVYDVAATAGKADAVQINVSGNLNTDGTGVGWVSANGIEIFNVKSSGSASDFLLLYSDSLREMNITGDANLTLDNAFFNNTAAVNTVNAQNFTGNLNIRLNNSGKANIDVAVTGGKGDDRADFSNGFDKNDAFDGGDDTDTLALANNVAVVVNPADFGTFENVETLEITDGGANVGASVLDLDNFPGVSTVYYSGLLVGATTVKDVASGFTVKVNNPSGQNLTTTLKTDGASDVLNLQVEKLAAGEVLKTATAAKFETVNLDVRDNAKVVGVGDLTINQLAINNATTLNITGDAKLTIFNDGNPTTPVLTTLNAEDQSGGLTLTGVDFAKAGATITFGSGDDTFNVATANGPDTITLGAGKDRVVYTAVAQSNKNMDTITDFVSGTDVVDVRELLGGIGIANSTQFVGNQPNFGQAEGALIGWASWPPTPSAVFDQEDQILWVDVLPDGTLDNNDFRVKLSGVTSLTAADLGFGVGNTITLTAPAANVDLTNKVNATNVTTNNDDTITTKTAFLAGSTIDAKGGTDVMNITDDLAGADLSGVTVTSVEQVNLLQGASIASKMFNGPTKIVSSAATELTLGTGGQTYVGSAAVDKITDGAGDDTIQTGAGNDTITLNNTSDDFVDAGDGNDTVDATTELDDDDTLIGGAGNDTLNVKNAAASDFNKVSGFETINLTITTASAITTLDDLVAKDANLAVNILGGATNTLTFDGSDEADGSFTFTEQGAGSAQNHVLTGGAGNDVFNLALNTGDLKLDGQGGNDLFNLGANLKNTDTIDGGAGTDTLNVTNDTATTDLDGVSNVEIININNSGLTSYTPTNDSLIDTGKTLTINALGTGGVKLDFSAETNGHLVVTTAGQALTLVTGGALADTVTGGAGNDTFKVTAGAAVSNWDTLVNWNFNSADTIDIPAAANRVTLLSIAGADVDESTLVAAMQATVNAAGVGTCWSNGYDVVVFTVNGGALNGNTYLAVNSNTGPLTVVDNSDYFVRLVGFSGTIDTSDIS